MQTITIHILNNTGRQREHLVTQDVTFEELPKNGEFINLNTPTDGSYTYEIIKLYEADAVEEPSTVPCKIAWYAKSVNQLK